MTCGIEALKKCVWNRIGVIWLSFRHTNYAIFSLSSDLYMYIGSNAGIVVRKIWEKVGCSTQQKGIVFLKSIFVIVKASF